MGGGNSRGCPLCASVVDVGVGGSYIEVARPKAWELAMATAQRLENGSSRRRVPVSNTAANMISSLYPFSKSKASAALASIKSSVINQTKVKADRRHR